MNVKAAEKICEVIGQIVHSTDPVETEGGQFYEDSSGDGCLFTPLSWSSYVYGERKKILGHIQIRVST